MSRLLVPKAEAAGAAGTLFVVAAATMLCLIVFTIPLTTIGAITDTLSAGAGEQAWIMSGMPVGAATGLLGFGALGDNYGRRRVFLSGLAIVVLASIPAAVAPNALILIVARIVQGVGSAALLSCGLGLIGQVFVENGARARAAGLWAAGLGAGVALGPIFAALLLPIGGWQASQWMIVLLSAALLWPGIKLLPRDEQAEAASIDVAGTIILAAAILSFLSALTQIRIGLSSAVIGLFVFSAVSTLLFIRIEARAKNPILQLGLFRSPDFVGATAGAFMSGAGVLSIMTMVPLFLQRGLGITPLTGAIILTAWSATTTIAALGAKHLPRSVSPRMMLMTSMTGCGCGQFALVFVGSHGGALVLLPGLLIAGIANGLLNASLGHQAVQTVPSDRTAMGSAANNTARYLGSAIGITLAAIIIAYGVTRGGDALFSAWRLAVFVSVAFSIIGVAASFLTGNHDSPINDVES